LTQTETHDFSGGIGTRAVHSGQSPDATTGAIMTPIFQTSTYVQPGLGQNWPFEYGRTRNPTRDALERNIAALENARHGFAFASGLAATETLLMLLSAGDHVICGDNVYGGTHRLMEQILGRFGLTFTFVDTRHIDRVSGAIRPETRLVFLETPTNPMMRLADLAAIAEIAKKRGLMMAVDNTFATPVFQRPIDLGADVVVHSTTKFLNGHSDMIGGVAVTSNDEIAQKLAYMQNAAGAVPGPFDCWLALRGTKTLHLRMERHDQSGRRIAEWLDSQPAVQKVYYPGLPGHPQHELARRQMSGFGGMISFETGSYERAKSVVDGLELFALAESLGGVESLVGHPASMTHASVPKTMREEMGLTDGLVRLSVGIEDCDDLLHDLKNALAGAGGSSQASGRKKAAIGER
jgi:cystathionine beta-lyase/cystathionine gamma-synthase